MHFWAVTGIPRLLRRRRCSHAGAGSINRNYGRRSSAPRGFSDHVRPDSGPRAAQRVRVTDPRCASITGRTRFSSSAIVCSDSIAAHLQPTNARAGPERRSKPYPRLNSRTPTSHRRAACTGPSATQNRTRGQTRGRPLHIGTPHAQVHRCDLRRGNRRGYAPPRR